MKINSTALASIALLYWLSLPTSIRAQGCGCNHTFTGLKTTSVNIINATSFNYKPGDIFCINAGTYAELRLIGFKGTADKPLIIKNCGGLVNIEGITYPGIQFRESSFIHLTGTGHAGLNYGIHISKAKDGVSGVSIQELSTDFEVDHLEISNVGFAGIIAKTDPECDRPETWRENFTMRNLHFHHNYIHNIGGEGFYVGGTFGYETSKKKCDNIERFAHLLENVIIDNNKIEETGWDGLQLNLTLVNAQISNNIIYGYGWKKEFAQNQGISLGSSKIKMFNNQIIQKPEHAVADSYGISMVSPFPGSYIFNNVVVGSGDYGIWTHVRTPSNLMSNLDTQGFYYINNTVVKAGASGMFYNARDGSNPRGNLIHEFHNNLIVDPKTVYTDGTFWKKPAEAFIDYNDKEQKDGAVLKNNINSRAIADVKFASIAANNYSILDGSIAINAGANVSSFGVTFDLNNGARPVGGVFDAGAYEFGASNLAPIADAGNALNVTIGETVTLNGSSSIDPDGTVSSYAWSFVSGPATPSITNANSAQATVVLSTAGVYIFSLTVTDDDGASSFDQIEVLVTDGVTGILPKPNHNPDLLSVFPNPAGVSEKISLKFSLANTSDVYMGVYSSTGAKLMELPTVTNATNETVVELDARTLAQHGGELVLLVVRTEKEFAVKRIALK
jgi:hypothetical protein